MAPPMVAIGPPPTAAPTAAPVPAPTISACEAQPAPRATTAAANTIAILDFIALLSSEKLKCTESIETAIAGSGSAGLLPSVTPPKVLVALPSRGSLAGNETVGQRRPFLGHKSKRFFGLHVDDGDVGADVGLHATVAVGLPRVLAHSPLPVGGLALRGLEREHLPAGEGGAEHHHGEGADGEREARRQRRGQPAQGR